MGAIERSWVMEDRTFQIISKASFKLKIYPKKVKVEKCKNIKIEPFWNTKKPTLTYASGSVLRNQPLSIFEAGLKQAKTMLKQGLSRSKQG